MKIAISDISSLKSTQKCQFITFLLITFKLNSFNLYLNFSVESCFSIAVLVQISFYSNTFKINEEIHFDLWRLSFDLNTMYHALL